MDSTRPNAVTTRKLTAFIIGFAMMVTLIVLNDDGYIRVIDDLNLVFHEAGHLIFGIFGYTPGLWGGTLGQLLMPLICAGVFLWRRWYVSVAVILLWFFQNFFNIAVYAGDARAQVLPLLGGGKHDWATILTGMNAMHLDTSIATGLRAAGWTGLALTLAWIIFLWLRDRRVSIKHQGKY